MKCALSSFTATLIGLATSSAVVHAQTGAAEFDHSRAILRDSSVFEPFYVEETIPLREALSNGTLRKDTPLALLHNEAGPLTLVMSQLMYHHLAQGEMEGEPWLVSF